MTFVRAKGQLSRKDVNGRILVPKDATPEEKFRLERLTGITPRETAEALAKAELLPVEYFRLRSKATFSLMRLSGKRCGEIAMLPLDNITVKEPLLNITFLLEKKRHGLVRSQLSHKAYYLSDPLAQNVIQYVTYLRSLKHKPKYFLPSGKVSYGTFKMNVNEHLKRRQVFNIIRYLSPSVWPHLARETSAEDVLKTDNTIMAAYKVQRKLDLEDMRTAFNYMKRFYSHKSNSKPSCRSQSRRPDGARRPDRRQQPCS